MMIATAREQIAGLAGSRKLAPSTTRTTTLASDTDETGATETCGRKLQATGAMDRWGRRQRRRRRRRSRTFRFNGIISCNNLEDESAGSKSNDKINSPPNDYDTDTKSGELKPTFNRIEEEEEEEGEGEEESNSMHLFRKAFKRDSSNCVGRLVATGLIFAISIAWPIVSTLASRLEPNERLQYLGSQPQQQQPQQWDPPSSHLAVDSRYQTKQQQQQQQQLHSQYLDHLRNQQQQQETMNAGQFDQANENQANFRGAHSLVHLLPQMGAADLHQQQQQQQAAQPYWTSDLWPSASNQQVEHVAAGNPVEFVAPPPPPPNSNNNKLQQQLPASSGNRQQVQPAQLAAASGSTTPTLSRQLMAPPPPLPFYEIGLAPTSAIQLELATSSSSGAGGGGGADGLESHQSQQQRLLEASQAALVVAQVRGLQQGGHHHNHHQIGPIRNNNNLMLAESSNIDEQQLINALNQHHQHQQLRNGTARSLEHHQHPSSGADNQQQIHHQQPRDAGDGSSSNKPEGEQNNGDESIKPNNAASGLESASNAGSQDQQQQQSQPVDKSIEPRQRRRIFNRILKKAEWNHLFKELSKVFVRYFLDLALKDFIGKQSGAGTETTTSRKKLDAQTELTDLLKDFVKTAISNI